MAKLQSGAIIGLVIAIILVAYLAPSAIDSFYSASEEEWGYGVYNATSEEWESGAEDTKTTAIWRLMPLIAVVVFLAMIAKYAGLF